MYWIITNTSTTDTTWPSCSLLRYLLPFPLIITWFLFIFTVMPLFFTLSFHLLSLLIRSSSVSAITTKSYTYNYSHGKATLNSLDKASMTTTNSKGLHAEPWCMPLSQNHYCYHKLFLQLFLHQYTDMTVDTNHCSTPNLGIAHLITSLRTLSKAFTKSTKPK